MRRKKLKEFNPPKDKDGNIYWIPVVAKNRDYLLGYIDSYKLLASVYDVPLSEISKTISSDRFNDILSDGTSISGMTKEELKEKVKNIIFKVDRSDNDENDESIYDEYLLNLDCSCGMFYGFKEYKEIPFKNMACPQCGKLLIYYTYMNDFDFEDKNKKEILEEIIAEINDDIISDGEI